MKKPTLEKIQEKIATYQIIVMLSFLFGVAGFIYNNWRYEHNEYNNNMRIAGFKTLEELANFEQIIYADHYDHNAFKGSPRDGWVKVGLINDLTRFISLECQKDAERLLSVWEEKWRRIGTDRKSVDLVVKMIDKERQCIRKKLSDIY